MDTERALYAQKEAQAQCLRAFSQLVKNINGWPDGRRKVAEAIAEYQGWTPEEADETVIQPAIDALDEYDHAHEALLESLR